LEIGDSLLHVIKRIFSVEFCFNVVSRHCAGNISTSFVSVNVVTLIQTCNSSSRLYSCVVILTSVCFRTIFCFNIIILIDYLCSLHFIFSILEPLYYRQPAVFASLHAGFHAVSVPLFSGRNICCCSIS